MSLLTRTLPSQNAAGQCRDASDSFGNLDGPWATAQFDDPSAVSVTAGNSSSPHGVFVADRRNSRIRVIELGTIAQRVHQVDRIDVLSGKY